MQQLLNDAQREVVADVVNAALLASATGKPKWEVKPQVRPTAVDGSMRCMLQTCSICGIPPLHLVSMMLKACCSQCATVLQLDCRNKVCAC